MSKTTFRVCTLCEATCGIAVETEGTKVVRVTGDADDPFSRGYICPKAYGMKALQDDPDRLRAPRIRPNKGAALQEVGWDEALEFAVDGLNKLRAEYGNDAVGVYAGNPSAHSLHSMIYGPVLTKALATKHRYSASSADQLPKMVSSSLLFGGGLSVPIPDLDRTEYLLILGANPVVSGGSLMTAPDAKGRIRGVRERGGKVIVVDPRRTETAEVADEHLFIRPGQDAYLLLALVHLVFDLGLADLGRLGEWTLGLEELKRAVREFTPALASRRTGIPEDTIRRVGREFAQSGRAVCYGRIGTTCQELGTLASWAVDVLNLVTGNLDREGGAMFPEPAANRGGNKLSLPGPGRGSKFGRWSSSVRGLWEAFGELPVSALAEEILDAPPEQRVRGMLTLAGNPLLSAPGSAQLQRAFESLGFMVSVDIYLNETTRYADVILPPPPPLERNSYDIAFYQLSVRNIAKYSPAAIQRAAGAPDEWEVLLSLAKGLMGMGAMDLKSADDFLLSQLVQQELAGRPETLRFAGLDAAEVQRQLGDQPGPARVLDLFLRLGPHGDGFGARADGLTLERLAQARHGMDLGPLQPRLPGFLNTKSGKIEIMSELIQGELQRADERIKAEPPGFVLIGRRQLRSNNSWMHNLHALVKGPERCTLLVNPIDAERVGLSAGGLARVKSRSGELTARVAVSDELMPGVVSLPHGWGHGQEGTAMSVAAEHPGVNVNLLSDPTLLDVSGNAAFNGVPVELFAADPTPAS